MLSQPFDVLLAHDRWATRQILEACVPLTREQFHQPFEMGPGSLYATATHLLGAMRRWTDNLRQDTSRPRLEADGQTRTAGELLAMLDDIANEFAAEAKSRPFDETFEIARDGKTYTFPRGGAITHALTHAMHHRAQCLNMLRHVGVKPLPLSSVLEWIRTTGGAK